ncbi:hypothetical protein TNCV_1838721 [Trichonephila clavipes]|nr:hypothetical protein TNCV_1838721 [Trichonephila clavipes]
MNETTQQEKTTELGWKNETTQLNRRKQLNSAEGTKQLDSAPPAPPLQQNRLFLCTHMTAVIMRLRRGNSLVDGFLGELP